MNQSLVDKVVQAVLYEGYILYPYRPSVKNHHRWTFGGLFPQAYSDVHKTGDACALQAECLVIGSTSTLLKTNLRFLHLTDRKVGKIIEPTATWPQIGEPIFRPVNSLEVNGRQFLAWQEAVERDVAISGVTLADLLNAPVQQDFNFPAGRNVEPLADASGRFVGLLIREQEAIAASMEIAATEVTPGVFKITTRAMNRTPIDDPRIVPRDDALMRSLVSTHAILHVSHGEFVSLTDPPAALKPAIDDCVNVGVWPVLVGETSKKDTMLASPIILYDYPQIAPESPGDMFDGTEIDEILTLRVMTLTDDEKRSVTAVDQRAGDMLKRTESLAREQLMNLHGTMRGLRDLPPGDIFPAWDLLENRPKLPSLSAAGVELHPGDKVRLHPRGGADAFDMMLAGKTATIATIEQDYEDRIHLAVTVEDDPGADFGISGKPGHRFFFRPDEVEKLSP